MGVLRTFPPFPQTQQQQHVSIFQFLFNVPTMSNKKEKYERTKLKKERKLKENFKWNRTKKQQELILRIEGDSRYMCARQQTYMYMRKRNYNIYTLYIYILYIQTESSMRGEFFKQPI